MAQHLVSGTKAAGCFRLPCGKFFGKSRKLLMQSGKNLLAVGMTNGNGPYAGADTSQGGLMQVNGNGLRRGASRRCGQCTKYDCVMPFAGFVRVHDHPSQRRRSVAGPWPGLGKLQELFAHVAACLSQSRRCKSRTEVVITSNHARPISTLCRTAGHSDQNAFERPEAIAD